MNNNDNLNVLRIIEKKPYNNQRNLANALGFSLGKINYCLGELSKKGLIKINNFKKNSKKIKYMYLLTPKGFTLKTKLTINFMKRKMQEYEELKNELKKNV
jgi:EPS-associated MarR family transcriptional regulator